MRKVVEVKNGQEPVVKLTGTHNHPTEEETKESDSRRGSGSGSNNSPDDDDYDHLTTDSADELNDDLPDIDEVKVSVMKSCQSNFVISDPHKPDDPIIYVSPGFTDMTGYDAKEMINKNCRVLQGPQTNPDAVRKIREAISRQKHVRVIILNYKKNGKPFWNLVHINPVHDADGKLISFVGCQTDVTKDVSSSTSRKRKKREKMDDVSPSEEEDI